MTPLAVMLAISVATLLLFSGLARDNTASQPGLSILGLPWEAWVGIALGAFAGVRKIVDDLLAFFKAEAPLTKTLVDDHIRDGLQLAHDKLDAMSETVNVLVGIVKPPGGVPVMVRRDPQAGFARLRVLAAIAILGVVPAVILESSCSATQARRTAATGIVAGLDCEAAHLDAQVLADATRFAEGEIRHWLAGASAPSADAIKAELAPIKSDLGRCAFIGAMAAVATAVESETSVAASALTGPPPGPSGCSGFCNSNLQCSSALSSSCKFCSFGACAASRPESVVHAAASTAMRALGWAPVKGSGGRVP